MTLASNTRLGAYEVVSLLGSGGMGEVYRARDTKLGREVAIKVLPASFAADPDRLARFEREARLLASLNHPNIGAIYGVEESSGLVALVLELVEGETLAARIQGLGSRGLGLADALNIARQIADALDAAHERGIVHRDLKPANIVITHDGTVKVLDFGLAKAGGAGEAGRDLTHSPTLIEPTVDGVLLGTAPYMSPEQARGKAVDKRSDIWAFGCVLYEMLTGHRAFPGETTSDTIAAILDREPDWTALATSTPSPVRRLIQRCLDKDPKRRLRDIGDARFDLDIAAANPELPQSDRRPLGVRPTTTSFAVVVVAVSILAGTLGVLAGRRRFTSSEAAPPGSSALQATQLTHYGLSEASGAMSPDGRAFAFVSNHATTPDIWLRQIAGGEPVRVTNDPAEERDVVYAADGETLFYTRADADGVSIWRVGALGGVPRKVLADATTPSPSPDGRRLAYYVPSGSEFTLSISTVDGGGARAVAPALPGGILNPRPAWSPDGRWLSYSTSGLFAPRNLVLLDVETGTSRQVTHYSGANVGIGQHLWLPDNRHVVAAYSAGGLQASSDLGVLDVTDGAFTRLTVAVGDSFAPTSLSADGSRLLVTASKDIREVWKVPFGPDPDGNGRHASRVVASEWNPLWTYVTRDGHLLLFNSSINGGRNLWTVPTSFTSAPRQLTSFSGNDVSHSSLSPDQRRVAFAALAGGSSEIWVQNVDGSGLRQLTSDGLAHSWPVWSPDGRSLVFNVIRNGQNEAWIAEVDGDRREKLRDGFFRGDWVKRPDGAGTWIVTTREAAGLALLIDAERRQPIWENHQPAPGVTLPMFSPDARWISVPARESRERDVIWILDSATGHARLGARLPFHIAFRADWTDGGSAFLVNKLEQESHVVLFDHVWSARGR